MVSAKDIISLLLAFFLPPLAVFIERGIGADLIINIILTILGWIPGIIHAFCESSVALQVLYTHPVNLNALDIIFKYRSH